MNDRKNNRIESHLRAQDDEAIVEPLIEFFRPVATARVQKREFVIKAVEPIQLILVLVSTTGLASWAAKRFIFNPLADRAEEWWQGVSFLWKQSKLKRQLSIVVEFEYPSNASQISIDPTSDSEALKLAWHYVRQAYEVYESARNQGIQLDKIRILPDGTTSMLVVGYRGNRPTYVIDLSKKTLKGIKSSVSTSKAGRASQELWELGIAIRRLDYLKMLADKGYDVSTDEVLELQHEIESRKHKLRS